MLKLKETIYTVRPHTAIEDVIISDLFLNGFGYLTKRFPPITAWGLVEHRCPKCGKAITNFIDWEFTLACNRCLGCESCLYDVEEQLAGDCAEDYGYRGDL